MGFKTLLLLASMARAESLRTNDSQQFLNGIVNRNYVVNSGAEKNVTGVTVSGLSLTRTTTTPIEGAAEFTVDASASTQTADWTFQTFQEGVKGQNCEVRFKYQGDASLYTANIRQGSTDITSAMTLTNTTNPQVVSINFPCGDASSATVLRIASTGNGAAFTIDSVYGGLATNLSDVSQAYRFGSWNSAATGSCRWQQTATTTYAAFGADTDCPAPTVSGGITAAGTKIPGFVIASGPAGVYSITCVGGFRKNNTDTGNWNKFRLHDGTNGGAENNIGANSTATNSTSPVIYGSFTYTSAFTSKTFQIQAASTSGSLDAEIYNEGSDLSCFVDYAPTQNSIALTPDTSSQVGKLVMTGSGSCLWTSGSGTWADYGTDAACNDGVVSGIAALPTTSKTPGFKVSGLKAGKYLVYASGAFSSDTTGDCRFRIYDGTNFAGMTTTAVNSERSGNIIGMFEYSSQQSSLDFRVQSQTAGGSGCLIYNDSADMTFEMGIVPVSQSLPSPLLVNSVVSPYSGVKSVVDADINCDAASSITSGDGGITAVGNRSTTSCALTIASGVFNSTPMSCNVTVKATSVQATSCSCASATSCTIYGPNADYDAYVSIKGAK